MGWIMNKEKEEQIVDWIVSSWTYSLVFLVFTQFGLAFLLVGFYVKSKIPSYWCYLVLGIFWWGVAILALGLIRRKLKTELKELE